MQTPPFRKPDWMLDGLCAWVAYPDLWFPDAGGNQGAESVRAIAICNVCPVQEKCLQYALENREHGIWGGQTEKQRSRARNRRARPVTTGKDLHMGAVVVVVLLGLVALGLVAAGAIAKQGLIAVAAILPVLLGVFVWLGASYNTVGTSDTGIITSYGHVIGETGSGVHWLPPWENITPWDHSQQRTAFTGPPSKDGTSGCLEIRIAGQQSACLDVVIYWTDNAKDSTGQFRQFKTFPRLTARYFSRPVVASAYNNVFEHFDPIALASVVPAKPGQNPNQQAGAEIADLTEIVAKNLRARYGNIASVASVNSGQISYDKYVEAALNSEIKGKVNYNIALLNEKTAAAQAAASKILQQHLTPLVVLQNCLNTTQALLQGGNPVNQAWGCNLFGNAGTSILLNGK